MCVCGRQGSKEGGDSGYCGGSISQRRNRLGSQWKKFRQKQGCGGDSNPAGVTGATEGWRGGAWTARSRVVEGDIGILVRRQVNPRWADDNVWRHVVGGSVRAGGGCAPPQKEIRRREEW